MSPASASTRTATDRWIPGRRAVIGLPFGWLLVFFMLPFMILLYISFVDMGNDIHPFKSLWDPQTGRLMLEMENYLSIFRSADGGGLFNTLYVDAYLRALRYAFWTTIL